MFDSVKIIAAHQEKMERAHKTRVARKLLWRTGMIPVEEYFFLEHGKDEVPYAFTLMEYIRVRNELWLSPEQVAQTGVLSEYLTASEFPFPFKVCL